VCVCVCVCVRERERERVCVCDWGVEGFGVSGGGKDSGAESAVWELLGTWGAGRATTKLASVLKSPGRTADYGD
jgi:hypothetical protein